MKMRVNKKKILGIVLLSVIMATGIAGCGKTDTKSSSATEETSETVVNSRKRLSE